MNFGLDALLHKCAWQYRGIVMNTRHYFMWDLGGMMIGCYYVRVGYAAILVK